jgi:hypothetical protein
MSRGNLMIYKKKDGIYHKKPLSTVAEGLLMTIVRKIWY